MCGLKGMDVTAAPMCKVNKLPVSVFGMDTPGHLKKGIRGSIEPSDTPGADSPVRPARMP
ncbi:MAG: hypothetical protein LIP00_05080 [Parabacteroides sp.]|nr:hypothetical protein [Parabacteroides sp.]